MSPIFSWVIFFLQEKIQSNFWTFFWHSDTISDRKKFKNIRDTMRFSAIELKISGTTFRVLLATPPWNPIQGWNFRRRRKKFRSSLDHCSGGSGGTGNPYQKFRECWFFQRSTCSYLCDFIDIFWTFFCHVVWGSERPFLCLFDVEIFLTPNHAWASREVKGSQGNSSGFKGIQGGLWGLENFSTQRSTIYTIYN